MKSKSFKSNVLAYTKVVESRLDEDFNGNWINEESYKYLKDNLVKISVKCVKELKETMKLEEELEMIDKNIKIVLDEKPVIDEKRKNEIFNELIDYVSVHCATEEDEYYAFRNIIGLSKEEMNELNLWFEKNYEEEEEESEEI